MSSLSHNSSNNSKDMESLFHPRSIAFAGITVSNPEHWTRTFFDSLFDFGFKGQIYLVNRRGGEIRGLKVYQNFKDIPSTVDYVISTVPAQAAPRLVEECADKGVKAIHFCTSGFGETGEEEGVKLEAQLAELAQRKGIRIIGPNCMGIYCPEAHISFRTNFPKESGPVAFISQSGGNTMNLVGEAMSRGVRFSKVISYGNACDLNESDFLEYLATDPDTKIVALYLEGVKDGKRFRQALSKVAKEKAVVLLKGGITEGGARTVAGHTGALAGSEVTWNSLCKQLGIIRVYSLEELSDVLVTLLFMPQPGGRRVALIGIGGGAGVLITDEFEKRGIKVPPLPPEVKNQIYQFMPIAGNILRNPIELGRGTMTGTMAEMERLANIVSQWEGIDFLVEFLNPSWTFADASRDRTLQIVDGMLEKSKEVSKPMAIVIEPNILPEKANEIFALVQKCVSLGLPVYYSFARAANAISLVLNNNERRHGKLKR